MFALDTRQVTKHEGLTTDYETAALPAELRRREAGKTLHPSNATARARMDSTLLSFVINSIPIQRIVATERGKAPGAVRGALLAAEASAGSERRGNGAQCA